MWPERQRGSSWWALQHACWHGMAWHGNQQLLQALRGLRASALCSRTVSDRQAHEAGGENHITHACTRARICMSGPTVCCSIKMKNGRLERHAWL